MASHELARIELGEADLILRALRHDEAAVRTIIRQNNRRLFRLARGMTGNDDEAEDVVQAAYVNAFARLASFRRESSLGTWLSRIVINEVLGRRRRHHPTVELTAVIEADAVEADIIPFPLAAAGPDPERSMAQREIRQLVEAAIDALPEPFRIVLVARLVEDLSVEETAALFELRPETVKTRLFRARKMLRQSLEAKVGDVLGDAFPFGGARCERIADRVVAILASGPRSSREPSSGDDI
ncbi:MAG: RNA polymerase subunit sigma [Kaistia sp. SCN 65-12]|nr:MAG: RNA polymerase subunit sigma [Kaistia sp. SCN 65-12]